MSMLWSKGRQLESLTQNGETISYTYDDSGMRLTKTVGGVEYTYLYEGGLLVQETRGSDIFDFSYDAEGNLCMLSYSSTDDDEDEEPLIYYYALNSRGDVIGLYNVLGNLIAKYTYDVWGNEVSITNASGVDISNINNIATAQPFRYRSYYFDAESNFYYLQSRYYDPVTHRFINVDSALGSNQDILSNNLFAYCSNNPVNFNDATGHWKMPNWLKVTIGAAVIVGLAVATVATCGTAAVICGAALAGAVVGGTVGAVSGYKSGGWSGAATGFMTGTIAGAASGALAASGGGYLAQAVGNGLINATSGFIQNTENITKFEIKPLATSFAKDFAIGGASSLIGGRGLFNSKESLVPAINTFDNVVSREIHRQNARYSSKIIARAMNDYKQAWMDNIISSGVRFIGATAFVQIFGG